MGYADRGDSSNSQVIKLQQLAPMSSQADSPLAGYMANVITDFKFINMGQAAAYRELVQQPPVHRHTHTHTQIQTQAQLQLQIRTGRPALLLRCNYGACRRPSIPVPQCLDLPRTLPPPLPLPDEFLLAAFGVGCAVMSGKLQPTRRSLPHNFCSIFLAASFWRPDSRDLPGAVDVSGAAAVRICRITLLPRCLPPRQPAVAAVSARHAQIPNGIQLHVEEWAREES